MKLIKTASGKNTIKLSKSEWQSIGKKADWMKTAGKSIEQLHQESIEYQERLKKYIEDDGGSITDYRLGELGKQEFMSQVLLEINIRMQYIPLASLTNYLEKLKEATDNMNLDINDASKLAGIINVLSDANNNLQTEVNEINNLLNGLK